MPILRQMTIAERFFSMIAVGTKSECWLWVGKVSDRNGYGQFYANGRSVGAHRFSYELSKGPIPPGLHIDHLCRNILCQNPDHLEAVTQAENNRRARPFIERHKYSYPVTKQKYPAVVSRERMRQLRRNERGVCSVSKCERRIAKNGLCKTHVQENRARSRAYYYRKKKAAK